MILWPALLLGAPPAPALPPPQLAALLPALEGWATREAPRRFTPDNLFEHINGAADGFLECEFRELAAQVYEGPGGGSLTVEIYRHADPDCAYGIYSQERSREAHFLPIAAEGYHEPGILNFLKGDCYVKLAGFKLGAGDRALLTRLAEQVASRIPGRTSLPALLKAFPAGGKVPGSERFIPRNVLGYPFLDRGFTAEYLLGGKRCTLWILAPGDEARARARLGDYLKSLGRREAPTGEEPLRVQDPHHGALRILRRGAHVLAVVGEAEGAERLLVEASRGVPGSP
ncbi:MAG: hypothetical protein HY823_06660 [Acidobacteria bacterium]|nr:hypothetical protein [Acidobacteriota bacterium]